MKLFRNPYREQLEKKPIRKVKKIVIRYEFKQQRMWDSDFYLRALFHPCKALKYFAAKQILNERLQESLLSEVA